MRHDSRRRRERAQGVRAALLASCLDGPVTTRRAACFRGWALREELRRGEEDVRAQELLLLLVVVARDEDSYRHHHAERRALLSRMREGGGGPSGEADDVGAADRQSRTLDVVTLVARAPDALLFTTSASWPASRR